jgi:nucleoid-associated protein YgaU
MEIFLDAWATEGPDVATRVATLFAWVRPTEESIKKKKPQPPILRFEWGGNKALQGFEAYLKTVSAKYLMFDGQGNPTRATASITLEEAPPTVEKQNPSSGAIHGRRTHIVKDGDSLQSVAWQEYDDPQLWRALADFNDIDDPLRVAPGTRLLIPSLTEASRSR